MNKGKTVVIGLDGATWSILDPLMKGGKLPNLTRIVGEGSHGTLISTIPPVTPPAWSSFVTGKNPGKHGLFGFVINRRREGSQTRWANESAVKAAKLWDMLGHFDRRSVLLNIPITYPAREIDGLYVAGFPTPEGADTLTYPGELMGELDEIVDGYVVNVPVSEGVSSESALDFTERNLECTSKRAKALFHIWEKGDPDMVFAVFMGTDRIQHKFYGYLDPDSPFYNKPGAEEVREIILRNYEQLDEILGEVAERIDEDTTLFIVSDHGFHQLESYVAINLWLAEKGYLKFSGTKALLREVIKKLGLKRKLGSLQKLQANIIFDASVDDIIDWSRTFAYAGDVYEEGIYLNVKGREENGQVEPGSEYEDVRDRLIADLKTMKFPGTDRPVFDRLLKREDVFEGEYVGDAPDILVIAGGHKSLITNSIPMLKRKMVKRPNNEAEGTHRPEGIFVAWGGRVVTSTNFGDHSILDMAPTILHAMGEPVFEDLDGDVILSIFKDAGEVRFVEPLAVGVESEAPTYTEEEEEIIEERLRQLGYLD